jgi:hypothetical protein
MRASCMAHASNWLAVHIAAWQLLAHDACSALKGIASDHTRANLPTCLLPPRRYRHAAAQLNGKVYVIGGMSARDGAGGVGLDTVMVYDIASNRCVLGAAAGAAGRVQGSAVTGRKPCMLWSCMLLALTACHAAEAWPILPPQGLPALQSVS